MKRLFKVILVSIFLLFIPQAVFAADVVINEYLPNPEGSSEISEWIEIYNTTETEINISGWKLDDLENGGSAFYIIPNDTKIASHGFYILERSATSIILNNDTDYIRLLDSSDKLIDQYIYNGTEENVYYGRSVDGAGSWVEFSSNTKGSSNSTGNIILSTTPTPQPTQQPTNTVTPSKTPTIAPTNTHIPSNSPTPLKKATVTISKISPMPSKTAKKEVLGESKIVLPTKKPTPTTEVIVKGSTGMNPGLIFMAIGGVFFLACGILVVYMQKKGHSLS